jgi:hypothetical protein
MTNCYEVLSAVSRWCECCGVKRGSARVTQGRFAATLCDRCVQGHHGRDLCKVCDTDTLTAVWHCQRVAHVAAEHPRVLERLQNDDFADVSPKPPGMKHLGTYYFIQGEENCR